jgi:hypothetical protein
MPAVELIAADVEDLRAAAQRLTEHGESVLAHRLEALADYASTAIRRAMKEEVTPTETA